MSGGWNTIESDAGVFTYLIENLGVKDVQFEELLSLDAETLAQLHPVYGVIFLFKFPTDQPYTAADRPHDGEFDRGAADRLFFAAQTIQNACATQALLSVLLNKTDAEAGADGDGSPDQRVDVGADLRAFRDFAMALPPDLRGEALSNSELIRDVHNSFARASPFADETRRAARDPSEAEDAFHFVAYTAVGGTLYELDGLQPAPISHGACGADGEQFAARVMEVLRRRVARYSDGEIRFNLLAVVRDLRLRARELGDAEMLARETARRREWLFENALRRHNFVGFAGEVLGAVVRDTMARDGDKGFDKWVAEGLERRKAEERTLRRAGKGGGDDEEDVEMAG